jgi:hypothetical protein
MKQTVSSVVRDWLAVGALFWTSYVVILDFIAYFELLAGLAG